MTLSRDTRIKNMETALIRMTQLLGERCVLQQYFNPYAPEFEEIHNTTWKALEDSGLIFGSHTHTSSSYRLTGSGWLGAIIATGEIETPEFKAKLAKLGKLSATIKAVVKGRRERGLTNTETLATQTGLPEWWIFNVIESKLWRYHQNRVGPEFDDSRTLIWVPIDFGMEPL